MTQREIFKRLCNRLFIMTAFLVYANLSFSQPGLPQRVITITPTQSIHFGALSVTGVSGGTVTVGYDGTRTVTGNILPLNISPVAKAAIFEIKLCAGRNIRILFDASTTLTSLSGGTLTLDIGPTERGGNNVSFAANSDCNFITPLRVGGTLHIPGNAPVGSYSGSFAITFYQE